MKNIHGMMVRLQYSRLVEKQEKNYIRVQLAKQLR